MLDDTLLDGSSNGEVNNLFDGILKGIIEDKTLFQEYEIAGSLIILTLILCSHHLLIRVLWFLLI